MDYVYRIVIWFVSFIRRKGPYSLMRSTCKELEDKLKSVLNKYIYNYNISLELKIIVLHI